MAKKKKQNKCSYPYFSKVKKNKDFFTNQLENKVCWRVGRLPIPALLTFNCLMTTSPLFSSPVISLIEFNLLLELAA
jgi:hypothetical protein